VQIVDGAGRLCCILVRWGWSSLTLLALSLGSTSANTMSIPRLFAMRSAVPLLSPVSMATSMPRARCAPGVSIVPADPQMSELGLVPRASPVQTAARNCVRDEGRPFEVGNQVLISSHRKLLSTKAMVVNVAEKSEQDFGRHD